MVGYDIDIAAGDGRGRCSLMIGPQHLNRSGVLHGGVIAFLLDNAAGTTASLPVDDTGHAPFVTVSLTLQFIAAVSEGKVVATGRAIGGGRKTGFVEASLVDEGDRLIATASGVFKRATGGIQHNAS